MQFLDQFLEGLKQTSLLEYIAVFSGIASVWFSKKENILVYPIGLINTIVYVYLSIKGELFGEASVNLYYTIVSVYGWWVWSKKNDQQEHILHITRSNRKEWLFQIIFFACFFIAIYTALVYLKTAFYA